MEKYYWLSLGIILIAKDALIFNTVFVFIFGISALLLSALIATDIIDQSNYIIQFCVFSIISTIFLAIIFIKRKFIKSKTQINHGFKDIIGNKATILENLSIGTEGKIKWSGTIVRAKISPQSNKTIYRVNEEVIIDSVEGNIFYIKEVN